MKSVKTHFHYAIIPSMIALKNVTIARNSRTVLKNVSLAIRPKECVCITGETESLSALFRILATLEKPSEGTVEVDNVDVSILPAPVLQLFRSRLGLVFDPPLTINHLTVGQNIALPLHLRGMSGDVITKAADDLLKRCGLTAKVAAHPTELSEEEKQMTCIARCLIGAPLVIVALEPFHALSDKNAATAASLFQNLRKKGATLILLSRTAHTAELMDVAPLLLSDGVLHQTVMEKPAYAPSKNDSSSVFTPPVPMKEEGEEETVSIHTMQESVMQRPAATEKKAGKIHITSIGSGL